MLGCEMFCWLISLAEDLLFRSHRVFLDASDALDASVDLFWAFCHSKKSTFWKSELQVGTLGGVFGLQPEWCARGPESLEVSPFLLHQRWGNGLVGAPRIC